MTGDLHRHGHLLLVKSSLRPGIFPVPAILSAGTYRCAFSNPFLYQEISGFLQIPQILRQIKICAI